MAAVAETTGATRSAQGKTAWQVKIRVVANKKPKWGGIQCTHAHTRAVMTARGEWPMHGHGGPSWEAQPAMLHIVDSWARRRDGTDGARRRSIAKQATQATQTDGHCGAISTQQGRPQAASDETEDMTDGAS